MTSQPPLDAVAESLCDYDRGVVARQAWPCDFCPHADYMVCLQAKIAASTEIPDERVRRLRERPDLVNAVVEKRELLREWDGAEPSSAPDVWACACDQPPADDRSRVHRAHDRGSDDPAHTDGAS